jgi:hypothetical protein
MGFGNGAFQAARFAIDGVTLIENLGGQFQTSGVTLPTDISVSNALKVVSLTNITPIATVQNTGAVGAHLHANTTYYYAVLAVDVSGSETFPLLATAAEGATPHPVILNWTSDGAGALNYHIYKGTSNAVDSQFSLAMIDGAQTSYTDDGTVATAAEAAFPVNYTGGIQAGVVFNQNSDSIISSLVIAANESHDSMLMDVVGIAANHEISSGGIVIYPQGIAMTAADLTPLAQIYPITPGSMNLVGTGGSTVTTGRVNIVANYDSTGNAADAIVLIANRSMRSLVNSFSITTIGPQLGAGSHMISGSGAPSTSGQSVGDIYSRIDGTPGTSTILYYCTASGSPDTWVGIL